MIVVGAGMGWIVRQAHVQRDAVAAIRRAGCSVMYNWEWSDGKLIPGGNRRRHAGLWISLELIISGMSPLLGVPSAQAMQRWQISGVLRDYSYSMPTRRT